MTIAPLAADRILQVVRVQTSFGELDRKILPVDGRVRISLQALGGKPEAFGPLTVSVPVAARRALRTASVIRLGLDSVPDGAMTVHLGDRRLDGPSYRIPRSRLGDLRIRLKPSLAGSHRLAVPPEILDAVGARMNNSRTELRFSAGMPVANRLALRLVADERPAPLPTEPIALVPVLTMNQVSLPVTNCRVVLKGAPVRAARFREDGATLVHFVSDPTDPYHGTETFEVALAPMGDVPCGNIVFPPLSVAEIRATKQPIVLSGSSTTARVLIGLVNLSLWQRKAPRLWHLANTAFVRALGEAFRNGELVATELFIAIEEPVGASSEAFHLPETLLQVASDQLDAVRFGAAAAVSLPQLRERIQARAAAYGTAAVVLEVVGDIEEAKKDFVLTARYRRAQALIALIYLEPWRKKQSDLWNWA